MEEAGIGDDPPFIAHNQAAGLPQLGAGAFDDPPATIAAQFAPILMGSPFMVAAGRLDDNEASIHIDDHSALQPVEPSKPFAPIVGPLHEEGANRPWREARRIHCHGCLVNKG
jgi:hypothetical protein